MDSLHDSELGPIRWLQQLDLLPLMRFLSAFGTDTFFLLVLPVVYWCVNPRLGLRLGLTVLAAAATNAIAKFAFHQPRPYWIDPAIRPLATEVTFGLPSGHAQTAAAGWGQVAVLIGRPWARWGAGILTLLIGVSRIYLGVHFISDVVVGAALGLAVLLLVIRLEEPVVAWWVRRPLWAQLVASAAVPGALVGAAALANLPYSPWTPPPGWPGGSESLTPVTAMAGGLLGTLAGSSIMNRLGWFSADGPLGQRVLRWLAGSLVAGLLFFLLRPVPDYARYAVLALWVQLGAPVLFMRLGLMSRPRVQ